MEHYRPEKFISSENLFDGDLFREVVKRRVYVADFNNGFEDYLKTKQNITLIGRIVGIRKLGKISFAEIKDESGNTQIVLDADSMVNYEDVIEQANTGNIISTEGEASVTKKGHPSLKANSLLTIARCITPMPDKFHGIKKVSVKRKERVPELITNRETFEFLRRSSIFVNALRSELLGRGYLEFDTPILRKKFAAGAAKPFLTKHNAWEKNAYLRLTSEVELKQLIISGFEQVFEIGKSFRNEGLGREHSPEFTLLEAHKAYVNYKDMMKLTEEIVQGACLQGFGRNQFTYLDQEIDFSKPWIILEAEDAFFRYCGVSLSNLTGINIVQSVAKENKIDVTNLTYGQAISKILKTKIQPRLIDPTFVIHLPIEMSPLTKALSNNPRLTERAWGFVGGVDFCDIYSDVTNPEELLIRLKLQDDQLGTTYTVHKESDLVSALKIGMPPCAGVGLSVNRLLMVLGGKNNIVDTFTFPNI